MFFYSENFLPKEGISNFFHFSQTFTGNSHCVWVYLLLLEGRIVPSCKLNVKLGPPLIAHFRFSIPLVFSSFTGILKNFSVISCFSIAIHTRTHHQLRTQKIFMAGFHSVAYGGRLYLVCTVCDVTI